MTAAGTGSKGRTKAALERTEAKPVALPVNPAGLPACLKERPQWVAWRYQWRDDHWTKVPIDPKTGRNAKADVPGTWGTFEQALACHRANPTTTAGIGYEFSADDPYCGIDLDDSIDPDTGELQPWARPIVALLPTYTETSPSATGVKLICEAAKPGDRCEKKYNGHKVEMYEHRRFFALTGQRPRWYPAGVEARHEELEYVYNRVFGEDESPLVLKVRGDKDEDLIWTAAEAANGDKFLRLWLGDTSLHHGDDSAADLALCNLLAFYCGPDTERIDKLFRRSGLMRGKWDEKRGKQTYGQRTIARALKDRTEFYGDDNKHEHNGQATGEPKGKERAKAKPLTVPIFRTAAQIRAQPVDWLWRLWIARGAVTLLDGDPELGKSTIAIDLAARVSRGWEMPPAGGPVEGAEPAGVLILSAEDSPEHTIRPRLDAAGADLEHVIVLDAVRSGEEDHPPVLPWDLDVIEPLIRERDIELVVIDPFMAFLDGEIDAHKDQDVRRCLHRLKLLAEKTNVAIVIIRHLNKLAGGPALYRGGGSIGIIGAARCSLIVGRDPDDHTCRVLACNKTNLGPKPRSLCYSLEPKGDVVRVAWGKECDLTADDILEHPGGRKKKSAAQECAEDMRQYLADGPKLTKEVEQYLSQRGHRGHAIKDARKILGVRAKKTRFDGQWELELPEGDAEGGDPAQAQ
jgi:hypothetical protein